MEKNFYNKWMEARKILRGTLQEKESGLFVLGKLRVVKGDVKMESLKKVKGNLRKAEYKLERVIDLLNKITESEEKILEAAGGNKKEVDRRLKRIRALEKITRNAIECLDLEEILKPEAFDMLKEVSERVQEGEELAQRISIKRTIKYTI